MRKLKDSVRHYNIPVFIPHLACPHQCTFCNQRYISGQLDVPTLEQVKQTIDTYLSTTEEGSVTELAFFGGSFTGIDAEMQTEYLKVVQPYIREGRIQSIRLSTRPDYIDREILDRLKYYNVTDIELGAQSLDNDILQAVERGHTAEDVERASELINSYGFNLGLQMMIGLPKDTIEKSCHTAERILELGAKTTRIYPTLVIDRTPLANMYRQGLYTPLSIEEAVQWTKEVYKIFLRKDITVLRVGLHPSKDILSGEGFLAGPFHVSFFELVLTDMWKDRLKDIPKDATIIKVNPKDINYAVGYRSSNRKMLLDKGMKLSFVQDSSVAEGEFILQ